MTCARPGRTINITETSERRRATEVCMLGVQGSEGPLPLPNATDTEALNNIEVVSCQEAMSGSGEGLCAHRLELWRNFHLILNGVKCQRLVMNPIFRRIRQCLFVGFVLVTWGKPVAGAELTFDAWADAFASDWVHGDPMLATASQYFDDADQDDLDRKLTPISQEFRAARVALANRGLAELRKFDRSTLSQAQRISAAMLEWQLQEVVEDERFEDYRSVFQQFSGLQVRLVNFLSQTHPIRNRRDVQNYLARLASVAGEMDEGIAQAKDRATRGFLPLDFILKSTLAQFDRF